MDYRSETSASAVEDPVCGMKASPETAAASVEHAGRTWHFCSRSCFEKFQTNPGKYAGSKPAVAQSAIPAAITRTPDKYTCPMHPQIVRDRPGQCPICGMALEPRNVSADSANPELADMARRFWIGVALTLPLLAVMVAGMLPGHLLQRILPDSLIGWIEFALATPVVLWAGFPFFKRGWVSIVHRSPNMFTLIAIGTGAAYLYSVAAVVAPGIFPATFVVIHKTYTPQGLNLMRCTFLSLWIKFRSYACPT
jgi:P-type Cu+ transporter